MLIHIGMLVPLNYLYSVLFVHLRLQSADQWKLTELTWFDYASKVPTYYRHDFSLPSPGGSTTVVYLVSYGLEGGVIFSILQ